MRTLALFGVAVLLVGCGKEASHQGRTLNEWIKELRDPNPVARRNAANALGELGPKAKPAVPDLGTALKDADDQVRINASKALWSIAADAGAAAPELIVAL